MKRVKLTEGNRTNRREEKERDEEERKEKWKEGEEKRREGKAEKGGGREGREVRHIGLVINSVWLGVFLLASLHRHTTVTPTHFMHHTKYTWLLSQYIHVRESYVRAMKASIGPCRLQLTHPLWKDLSTIHGIVNWFDSDSLYLKDWLGFGFGFAWKNSELIQCCLSEKIINRSWFDSSWHTRNLFFMIFETV